MPKGIEKRQKILIQSHTIEQLITIILICAVGIGGFILGRLYDQELPQNEVVYGSVFEEDARVVASKNGTKYHFPWCGGARRISPENLITFDSLEEARASGYTPAQNCKGLK